MSAPARRTNLTGQIDSVFVNMEDDHPIAYRRGYGFGGWLTGEKSVLLYDRFDVWQVNIDGRIRSASRAGKKNSTVYRVERAGSEKPTIDPSKTIVLSATGEFNKKSGFRQTEHRPAGIFGCCLKTRARAV